MTSSELKQYRAIVAEIKEIENHGGNESLLVELRAEKQRIEDFVNSIQDSEMRLIFRYRYIYGKYRLNWQYIAFRIGRTDESYPRRKHKDYLQEHLTD